MRCVLLSFSGLNHRFARFLHSCFPVPPFPNLQSPQFYSLCHQVLTQCVQNCICVSCVFCIACAPAKVNARRMLALDPVDDCAPPGRIPHSESAPVLKAMHMCSVDFPSTTFYPFDVGSVWHFSYGQVRICAFKRRGLEAVAVGALQLFSPVKSVGHLRRSGAPIPYRVGGRGRGP